MRSRIAISTVLFAAVCLAGMQSVFAGQFSSPDMGKLLATGGVSQIEGAGGGGIVPWALISGYGTRDSFGANVHATAIKTQDYALGSFGAAAGINDRVELSLATQTLKGTGGALNNIRIKQDIFGVKVKIAGDAVYEQDSLMPQIAVGALFKHNNGITGLGAVNNVKQLGAAHTQGIDYYIAATKILLDESLLLNTTLRFSKANQIGLLGFGGDLHDRYQPLAEVSAAYLINRKWAAGMEYRMKPHNLSVDKEKNYYDVFVAYFPTKNFSLTAAYAVLGDITVLNPKSQKGAYLSAQIGF